ncbi:MAG: hypothetical protein H6607_06845 [Flavobacteriales bacterium]|nr:hypothetical protein [Flavobacteriales bacterium]
MSCSETIVEDAAPTIEYKGYELEKTATGFDSLLYINFDYGDKDGNLGLGTNDTMGAFKGFNNLNIKFFEKKNGIYIPMEDAFGSVPDFSQRIPNLTPTGKNKEIQGSMRVSFGVNSLEIAADTLKFELYIVDRNFNESNRISASDIVLLQK